MALTATPVTPGALSLTGVSPTRATASYYGVARYGISPYGGTLGLTLAPVTPGALSLVAA